MTTRPFPSNPSGPEREQHIYQLGLTGNRISAPIPIARMEEKAREILSRQAYDYVAGGAGGERTMRANLQAFDHWRIIPRMLRDVSQRDLRCQVLGFDLPAPVLLGPVGVQGIIHPDAEIAAAKAAASLGLPFVLSTVSSRPIEEVAQAAGEGVRWFQLYWGRNPDLTASMLRRAERAGYKALMVTLDTSMLGWRERDLDHGYLPFILGQGLANYVSDPVFRSLLTEPPEKDPTAAVMLWGKLFSNTTLTWKDLSFLRQHTKLPILLKGILHPEDAQRALDAGVDGIVVSNHGGRQVDGAIAALDALPRVVEVVKEKVPVLFDSGIRWGADVMKALALGAKAVLLGRLYMWGLAVGGEQGARDVVLNLLADLDLTMGLSGYKSCTELNAETLTRSSV